MILAIDPGNIESAYCLIDKKTCKPIEFGKVDNQKLILLLNEITTDFYELAIEMIASYGMPVGKEVFETCVWIGRFTQEYYGIRKQWEEVNLVYRKDVKINLCNSMRAKDTNIRQALIDRFGVVGTKKEPGYFYGFKADIWSAYAVGITYLDKLKEK